MKRALLVLGLAAGLYVAAAWTVAPGFYDGFGPQAPYRWVSPPPQFKSANQPPLSGQASIRVNSSGVVDAGSVFTQDGQASISFIPGSFEDPADRSPVTITVKPVASYPNAGNVHLATNVYCVTSSAPLAPGKDVLVTLTFSDQLPAPSSVYEYQGSGPWGNIGSTGTAAPFSISARAGKLECFAGGYPASAKQSASGVRVGGGQTLPIVIAVAILAVVLAGIPLALVRRRGR
ncbi:MAG: hypothetical protein DLM67_26830 [Candidatus Nephthysia bennettiae]|uniref:Ig-like domain repeat protein n=1 Tax=Candidatus Nephthysia bennettiae TaxID=3127016 RepID=A0A934K1A4_9BACT|nr:hypothetical protein [Candidatus Dormibacteraeota bacterium]MBJ7612677.1 hypothetical protein [Candidatus Dormibacteraeota bacterium]PZR84899.1 MAG: hypothetical protein DLM67_26830 [Candidatus Dormibacteraeota bacterium]